MRHGARLFFAAIIGLLAGGGCPSTSSSSPSPSPDASLPAPSAIEETHRAIALLLDHDIKHPLFWSDVISGLHAAGVGVDYRRFYPHLTETDADSYDLVIIASGSAPAGPSTMMRLAELDHAERLLNRGKALVLLPTASQEDVPVGENETVLFNYLLERTATPLRIERGLLFGTAFVGDPAPPHEADEGGYPGTLEPVLGYAWIQSLPGAWGQSPSYRLPAGRASVLRVGEGEVSIFAQSYDDALLWRRQGGAPEARIEALTGRQPVAAAAAARDGHVVVMPRSLLTMASVTGALSDKPAGDFERRSQLHAFSQDLLAHIADLAVGDAQLDVMNPQPQQELEAVDLNATYWPISERAVPSSPPAGRLHHSLRLSNESDIVTPAWMHPSKGRVAYGALPDDDRLADAFHEAEIHGLDVLMTQASPERMVTGVYGTEWASSEPTRLRDRATVAAAFDVAWFIGGYLSQMSADPASEPQMEGPLGQDLNFMALLGQRLWDDGLHATFAQVGHVAEGHPGLAGLHLDLELYGGPVHHKDLYAFSDDTWGVFTRRLEAADVDAAMLRDLDAVVGNNVQQSPVTTLPSPAILNDIPRPERLLELIDRGLLGTFLLVLEDETARRAESALMALREQAPHVELSVYLAGYPDSWFHRGLLKGLSTQARPVSVLTYEAWVGAATRALWAEEIYTAHLGGTLVSFWRPQDFDAVLTALALGSDGYWFLAYEDISQTNAHRPPLFGTSSAYWEAVQIANAAVSAER